MHPSLLELLSCPHCEGELAAQSAGAAHPDRLLCPACGRRFDVVHGVPVLLDDASREQAATSDLYGDIWSAYARPRPASRRQGYRAPARSHLELLELASGWELVEGTVGIDAGCGNGTSTLAMAQRYADIHVVGVDLSEGPLLSADAAAALPNAHFVRGNLLAPPLARGRFDFAFSFGVLHHTPDPELAFRRLLARLRPGGRITVFLYKDFSDLPAKRAALRAVNLLRALTTRLPPRFLRALSWVFAPLVLGLLTWPARGLKRLGATRFAQHIPYGTFPHLESIASSLEDRFGVPFEFRFSRRQLEEWVERSGLAEARVVDCLPFGFSGLVLAGRKP